MSSALLPAAHSVVSMPMGTLSHMGAARLSPANNPSPECAATHTQPVLEVLHADWRAFPVHVLTLHNLGVHLFLLSDVQQKSLDSLVLLPSGGSCTT